MENTDPPRTDTTAAIEHTGVVESLQGDIARVRIYHGGNCGACPAKGGCASASFGESGHVVDIHFKGNLVPGQKVRVALKQRTDFLAICLAFGVPILILAAGAIGLVQLGLEQKTAALVSLGLVGAYLGLLALLRKQLQQRFELTILD